MHTKRSDSSVREHDLLNGHIEPMLAVAGKMPGHLPQWAFEFKWDGIRALCFWNGSTMRLQSRNLLDITSQYPDLVAGSDLGREPMILDGEIVAIENGRPSFGLLQQRMHVSGSKVGFRAAAVPVQYFLFDILLHGRGPLLDEPYSSRRKMLERMKLSHPRWRVPPSRVEQGPTMLTIARRRGLEGLVAKRVTSSYQPGARSHDWVKIKIVGREEFVIGGWEPRRKNADEIGSLLLGYYTVPRGALHFAGRVGTGFSSVTHRDLLALFRRMEIATCPFNERIGPREARYIAPRLVAEVEYRRWPAGGQLQQASFLGLRDDKTADSVVLDRREEQHASS